MAVGDESQDAGFGFVPNTGEEGKVKWGAREINRTRDFLAQVKDLILNVWPVTRGGTGSTTAVGARSNLGLGSVSIEDTVPISKGGTSSTNSSSARSSLGLGSVATENTVPISKGGTSSTSSSSARSSLGIGHVGTFGRLTVYYGGTGGYSGATARSNLGITSGTGNPSGGTSGDIYFKII